MNDLPEIHGAILLAAHAAMFCRHGDGRSLVCPALGGLGWQNFANPWDTHDVNIRDDPGHLNETLRTPNLQSYAPLASGRMMWP